MNAPKAHHLSESIRALMEDEEPSEELAAAVDEALGALDEIAAALEACQYAQQRGFPLERRDRELRATIEKVMANTY